MDSIFALVGDGFALVVADTSSARSIIVNSTEDDKIMLLDSHKLLGASGPSGDRVQFTEFIQKNLHLYSYRNTVPLSTHAAAHFTRNELAGALRSRGAYQTNLLLAGYDSGLGPSLYYLDYLATLHKLKFTAFGYCSYLILSIFDKYYKEKMTVDEAVALADKCIQELKSRLVIAPPNFVIKIVDKDGARELVRRRNIEPVIRSEITPAPEDVSSAPVAAQS